MRSVLAITATLSVSLALMTACGDPAKPVSVEKAKPSPAATQAGTDAHGHEDNAQRITVAEAKAAFDKGDAIFVDTRATVTWEKEHIKGSINVPAEEAALKANTIPKGKKIIAYCS